MDDNKPDDKPEDKPDDKPEDKPGEVVEDEDDEDDEDDDDVYEEDEEEDEEEGGVWVSRQRRTLELKLESKSSLGTESKVFSEEEAEEESVGQAEAPPETGPAFLNWTPQDVANWIDFLGFPQYKVKREALLCPSFFGARMEPFLVSLV